ncbi:MAG: amidohydrolase family protein [Phycisphaerae bacterium]|nr:amidohydrolase family protein [Phycisphaerae bacterium]
MKVATEIRDDERALFQRELDAFVPSVVFDAHAHLYDQSQFTPDSFAWPQRDDIPARADLTEYRRLAGLMLPGRRLDGLFIPMALDGDPATVNGFIADQVRGEPRCRGAMVVRPDMDPDYVRQEAGRLRMAGLKCYHFLSKRSGPGASDPTWEREIPEYLPEPIVRVADELGLTITLHMVKLRALADAGNQQAIRHYAERYPNMRLILAHAARGFNPHHTIEGIAALAGLRNVWFDCSAVTDCGAIEAIVETFGHERLMYGSDFHVSHFRGRCVAIGESFLWLYEDSVDWSTAMQTDLQPILVGLESLRCLKLAARHTHLTDAQVEDVFYNNAARLFELT